MKLVARDMNRRAQGQGCCWQALTRENMQRAWKRVKANKGAAGVDGLDIDQTGRASEHGVAGDPRATVGRDVPAQSGATGDDSQARRRRARTRHPDGDGPADPAGAAAGAATADLIPTFSEHSYGFRPGRRAHDAVLAAQQYVQVGPPGRGGRGPGKVL